MTMPTTMRVRSDAGFTILEVLVAALMLGIGLVGILALQATATVANRRALETRNAMQVAHTTMERAKVDAIEWTASSAPSPGSTLQQVLLALPGPSTDLSDTNHTGDGDDTAVIDYTTEEAWTFRQLGGRFVTQNVMNLPNVEDVQLPGGSRPVALRVGADYCVATRAFNVVPNEVVRLDVRVFWPKNRVGAADMNDNCDWFQTGITEDAIEQRFNSVWLSSTVRRNDASGSALLPPST